MADKKISELTNITGANLADTDEFVVVDASETETKAITWAELKSGLDTGTGFVRVTGDTMTGDLTINADLTATGGDLDLDTLDLNAIAESKAVTAVDVFVYDTSKDSDGGAWRKRTQHTSWYNETLNTTTRGSRREFPAVAVIVAESNKVTIYDGDDPSLPMWMVFGTISNSILRGSANDVSSAVMGQAQLIVGANDSSGLYQIDFLKDHGTRYASAHTSNTGLFHLTIAQRQGTAPISIAQSSDVIVNATVNDVAITVLPDAPIDPATGLPVPTIAVATAGGVSVIKDDGTVVDIEDGSSVSGHVDFDADGNLWFNEGGAVSAVNQFVGPVPESDVTGLFTSNGFTQYSYASLPPLSPVSSINKKVAISGGAAFGHSGGKGLSLLKTNPADKEAGLVAGIASTYNTGWMNGDIKGAFLSDTDDTDLVGSVYLDDDFTSYADQAAAEAAGYAFSDCTFDAANDQVDFSGTGIFTFSGADPSPSGEPIIVKIVVSNRTTGNLLFQAAYSQVFALGETGALNANGTYYFSCTSAHLRVLALNGFDGSVDSVTIYGADADRSVNANGLIVNGTVTRSAVATGAELVAYSGFSASNYLEQPYNSDLDFGTGDFCVMGWFIPTTTYGMLMSRGSTTLNDTFIYNNNGPLQVRIGNGYTQTVGYTVTDNVPTHLALIRKSDVAYFYVNGSSIYNFTSTENVTDTSATLRIGQRINGATSLTSGSLALWRISATAPTAEQIKKIYEDEKVLFQENAACTLYGTSDAVTALAHDSDTNLLHVGTSDGRSVFQGLRRVSNTTTAVGTAISAANGLIAEE